MSRARLVLITLTGALAMAGCSTEHVQKTQIVQGSAVDHGQALFSEPAAPSAFSCATCHAARPGDGGARILPGGALAGATSRASFWGGQENDLLRSINDCRRYFMAAPLPWTPDDEEAKAMYAYLSSLPQDSSPIPFTVARTAVDLSPGDAQAGADVFSRACQPCHGAIHTGAGRLTATVPRLPDDPIADHASFSAVDRRVIFVEKIRHGPFLGYGGAMPPFSEEALSDEQIAGLLTYLGLY